MVFCCKVIPTLYKIIYTAVKSQMKILITGSHGFVGKEVVKLLHEKGHKIISGDRTRRYEGQGVRTDAVVHLAAKVHDMKQQNEADYFQSNLDLTLCVASEAIKAGVRRFVFVSTAKVFGERSMGSPFCEGDIPNPQDAYARSKLAAEQELMSLAKEGQLEVVIFRPPLVYGPGVRANFRKLLRLVSLPFPIPLGSARNRRTMVYVKNLAELICLGVTSEKAVNQVFIASDDTTLTTSELILRLGLAMGKKPSLFPIPGSILKLLAMGVGMRDAADKLLDSFELESKKARDLLGFVPPYGVDQALRETVQASGFSG